MFRLLLLLGLFCFFTGQRMALGQHVSLGSSPSARRAALPNSPEGLISLENAYIKVGVNSYAGGAITHLSFQTDQGGKVSTRNMISNPDLGRQIQIGLYGGPADYSASTTQFTWINLGWDPIQAGDVYGNPSEVVISRISDNSIHTTTIPKQFAFNNQPGQAVIDQWIKLVDNVVLVHVKVVLSRSDKNQYEARQQEFPCMYLTGDYHNIWHYAGTQPFTNGDLTLSRIQPPQTSFNGDVLVTEPWMASTNDNGYGVGLYVLGDNYEWKNGYLGQDLGGDETSSVASYVAATPKVQLDYNITYEWDYALVVGHLDQIRQYVYQQKRAPSGPVYLFDTSRKGWTLGHIRDTGWPIQGKLHLLLDDAVNARISSPYVFWRGKDNPKLYLRAAFQTQSERFLLNWRRWDDAHMYLLGDRSIEFPVINDGQYHTYELDLSQNTNWLEALVGQIEFSAVATGDQPGAWVDIQWLCTCPNGPDAAATTTTPCKPGTLDVQSQKVYRYRPKP